MKLYQYDTKLSGYKIYPLDLGEVALIAGRSYFTRLKQTVEVDVGGAPNLADKVLELKDAGWHAIGNPFTLLVNVADLKFNEVGFSQAVTDGLVEETLYRWKATATPPGTVDLYEAVKADGKLEPWEGYWLRTKKENVKLTIPSPSGLANFIAPLPASYQPPLAPPLTATAKLTSGQGQFELRLALTSELASDLTTVLGAKSEAQLGFDRFDSSEPPTLSGTVSAYFEHNDWSEQPGLYNSDYQPPLEIGQERNWQFVVYNDNTANPDLNANANANTNTNTNTKLRLSWEEAIGNLPLDTMFYFRQLEADADSAKDWQDWQDMRSVRFVELKANGRVTKLRFEVKAVRFELTPPEAISVIAGEKQVTLKWAKSDNPFITGYAIERRQPGESEAEAKTFELSPTHLLTHSPTHVFFIDTEVSEEVSYSYQLSVHFVTGASLKSELFFVKVQPVIKSTRLLQNYPNPFNPETWIPYELKQDAKLSSG